MHMKPTRKQLNAAAARVTNAIFYGTPEMVAKAEAQMQALLRRA